MSPVTAELSETGSRALLERACAADGLDASQATLLRIGSNAVFHLSAPVVVRISRQGADIEEARRTVAVARWLESVGYPAVRLADVDQPVIVDGHTSPSGSRYPAAVTSSRPSARWRKSW